MPFNPKLLPPICLGIGLYPLNAQVRPSDPASWIDQAKLPALPRQGFAFLDLEVATDGSVASCRKRVATVPDKVCENLCAQIRSTVRYKPAGAIDGSRVTSRDTVHFKFSSTGLAVNVDFGGALPLVSPAQWITNDDYPSAAQRAHLQGDVTFSFFISSGGNVSDCVVQHSSGVAILDQVTCALIKHRAKFSPPLGLHGEPLPTVGRGVYLWRVTI